MPDDPSYTPTPVDLAAALGRLPSGLFILTVRDGDRSTGMLASWVQQAGFEPPMITVALQKQRYVLDWVRAVGRFVLNQVRDGDRRLIRHFGKGFAPDEPAFEGIACADIDGAPGLILGEALSYLVVEVAGELEGGDHVVVLGRVVEGLLIEPDAEPMLHVRRSGLHY